MQFDKKIQNKTWIQRVDLTVKRVARLFKNSFSIETTEHENYKKSLCQTGKRDTHQYSPLSLSLLFQGRGVGDLLPRHEHRRPPEGRHQGLLHANVQGQLQVLPAQGAQRGSQQARLVGAQGLGRALYRPLFRLVLYKRPAAHVVIS